MTTPQTPELEVVEQLLPGRDATLDAALAWLHRHLQGEVAARLRRIELRYAPQRRPAIGDKYAQARVVELCGQKGLVGMSVSVRTHELPMDNDLGHLRIRLRLEPQPRNEGLAVSWRQWLARVRDRVLGQDEDEPGSGADATHPMRHAVEALQRGLDAAVQQHRSAGHPPAVKGLRLVVFSEQLHRSLAPRMPPADTQNAMLWLGRELLERGLQTEAQWQVHYEYRPPLSDNTSVVTDGDLSVRLLLAGDTVPARPPAPHAPESTETPMPAIDGETPLPLDEAAPAALAQQVVLRVLGTWQGGALQPLPQPFEASLGSLPTQFSRSMLEVVGFTASAHAPLAGAASNSTPLGFAADGPGSVKLHTAARPGGLPMYHFVADGKPCLGEHPLSGPVQLVVNGPARLQNGLWPLVIEVVPTGGEQG